MIDIEFIKEFADKKIGDIFKCDSQLAAHLIGVDKVAKLYKAKAIKPKK